MLSPFQFVQGSNAHFQHISVVCGKTFNFPGRSWLCFKVCSFGRSSLTVWYSSAHAPRNVGPPLPERTPWNNVLQFWQGSPVFKESYLWILKAYENFQSCRSGLFREQKCITEAPRLSLKLVIRLYKQIGLTKSLTATDAPTKNFFEGLCSTIAKTSGKMFLGLWWASQIHRWRALRSLFGQDSPWGGWTEIWHCAIIRQIKIPISEF